MRRFDGSLVSGIVKVILPPTSHRPTNVSTDWSLIVANSRLIMRRPKKKTCPRSQIPADPRTFLEKDKSIVGRRLKLSHITVLNIAIRLEVNLYNKAICFLS